jgi:hypothetical protein
LGKRINESLENERILGKERRREKERLENRIRRRKME